MSGRRARRVLTVMLVPDRGQETHTFRVAYGTLRLLGGMAVLAALALTLVAGSWWYLAARASRVSDLEEELATLEAERNRVGSLGRQLEALEQQYGQFRQLFGLRAIDTPSEVWLPPVTANRSVTVRTSATSTLPDSWPLAERGFVTQGLLDGADGAHPGLDIAVPTDSYVRAAGAGNVVDMGDDPVYGRYVLIDHGDGYTTRYGHASVQLVSLGQGVRQNEVIALSGSSGRSTAPHLHFEILLHGEPVDPLTLVTQP